MRSRFLSALVLIPVVLGLTYWGGTAFDGMLLIAAALMAYEWNRISCGGAIVPAVITIAAVLAGVAAAALKLIVIALGITVLSAGFASAVMVFRPSLRRALWVAIGIASITLPCIAIIWLRTVPEHGLATILWLLAVIWATDSGAYFAGRGIGGPKLAPRISPNKTWAGLAGGMIAAALVGATAAILLELQNMVSLIALSTALAVIAQGGDLLESAVKRHFKVKDSGGIIPGHGGLLDRLDGLATAAPVVAGAALISGEGVLTWG